MNAAYELVNSMYPTFFCFDTRWAGHVHFHFPRNVKLVVNVGEIGKILYVIQAKKNGLAKSLEIPGS
jgi:hypothetical protein